jgi:hypothetical protein
MLERTRVTMAIMALLLRCGMLVAAYITNSDCHLSSCVLGCSQTLLEPAQSADRDIYDRLQNPAHFPACTITHLLAKTEHSLEAEQKAHAVTLEVRKLTSPRPPSRESRESKQPSVIERLTDHTRYVMLRTLQLTRVVFWFGKGVDIVRNGVDGG